MSAIFGLMHLNGRPAVAGDLDLMNAALSAQGTDGGGIWAQGHIGLGQCLMCFTPEDRFERQPLVGADGQITLVSASRIDNRRELMSKLEIPASEAQELPDSAFILRSYCKWGEACVRHLIGAFVFALWDMREQFLLLARSPIGSAPLFYHATPHLFAFATKAKGLFALPIIPREINPERLSDLLTNAISKPGTSFFRCINRLQGGHSLIVRREGFKLQQNWRPDLSCELRLPHDEDYVEAFQELFCRVVADHLRSLTPVGVMMSGGLDSTSVAATAAMLLKRENKRLAAFTEVPRAGFDGAIIEGRYADESPFVHAMADMYDNLDLNLIRTDGRFLLQDIDEYLTASEAPFINATNRVWYEAILQESRRQDVRVLLMGSQGNLTISWQGSGLLPQLLRKGRWGRALHEVRAIARQLSGRSTLRTLIGQGLLPLLPTPLWLSVERARRRNNAGKPPWQSDSAINPEFAREQRVAARARVNSQYVQFRLRPDTRLHRSKVIELHQDATCDITSGYQAQYGVDMRDPTADVRIIEFCLSLPEEQYLHDGVSRRLIRRAMAERLPVEVLANRQRGLQAADWFERLSGACSEVSTELTRLEQSELARHVLDLERMRQLVKDMPRTVSDAARVIADYRHLLERGLMTGRFLRWFESGGYF